MAGTDMRARLEANSKFFDKMLDFIPSKYYFPSDKPNEQWKNRFRHHNSQGLAPRQAFKENSRKGKKRKLDPAKYKTVSEIQANGGKPDDSDSSGDDSHGSSSSDDSDAPVTKKSKASAKDDGSKAKKDKSDDKRKKKAARAPLPELAADASLRERLQHRIQQLKRSRNADEDDAGDAQEAKRLKRAKAAASNKKDANKPDKRKKSTKLPGSKGKKPTGGDERGDQTSGGVQFSKFDFTPKNPQLAEEARLKDIVKKKKGKAGRNKDEETLRKAEALAKEKAEGGASWGTLLQKAEGVKIKDNPALVKKTMKRKQKAKEKSSAKWKDRVKQAQSDQKAKQKKRMENLTNRSKKGKKQAKSGGGSGKRVGFEGKKKGFINKKK